MSIRYFYFITISDSPPPTPRHIQEESRRRCQFSRYKRPKILTMGTNKFIVVRSIILTSSLIARLEGFQMIAMKSKSWRQNPIPRKLCASKSSDNIADCSSDVLPSQYWIDVYKEEQTPWNGKSVLTIILWYR